MAKIATRLEMEAPKNREEKGRKKYLPNPDYKYSKEYKIRLQSIDKSINEWYKFIEGIIKSNKKYYAYDPHDKVRHAEEAYPLRIEKSQFSKTSPYQYDNIIWTGNNKARAIVGFYKLCGSTIKSKFLDDGTFIIGDFMILFPTKEVSKCYEKYVFDRKELQKKREFDRLKNLIENPPEVSNMSFSEIENYVSDLLYYISLLPHQKNDE